MQKTMDFIYERTRPIMDHLWMYCKRAYKAVEKVITKQEINQIVDQ